jgi:YidC/Oxa1 family membrane protein insertase
MAAMPIANILQPLIDAEEWTLERLHDIGLGWGLAIIGLTLIVRAAILPVTVKQFRAQRELRAHMPELKRLRERHKDDPQRLQQETLAYYREHGLNPAGAFLPVLLQIPVFISLYYLMRTDVASGLFGHSGFLFIPDLTARPHGAVLVALLMTYTCSQLAASAISTRALPGSQRGIVVALPLVFAGVAARFPAGLLVYWITTSLWTLAQQLVLWRLSGGAPAPAQAAAVAAEASAIEALEHPRRPHPVSRKKRRKRKRRR